MSSTSNHKKAITILRQARKTPGMTLDILLQILADQPSAIINASRELMMERSRAENKHGYVCKDCKMTVDAVGIVGACLTCDPAGFDVPY